MFHSLIPVLFILSLFLLPACTKKTEKPRTRPPALVVVSQAVRRDVPVQLKAVGTMEASESVVVKSQISGELTRVAFREGQEVQQGALLFQIDPRPYQAAVKKAEATLARDRVVMENARSNYKRYSQLVKEGIVTQEQAEAFLTTADSAAATVAADQAELENARAQFSYCTIAAPISGRLGVLSVDRGNLVKANETVLVTINRISPIHASFTIPEKDLSEVKRQMGMGRLAIEAAVTGPAGFSEQGTISFMDNTVDPATGTIRLKGTFANQQKRLWPGQFVNLSITLALKPNAVVVPAQAIQTGQKGTYVYVIKPDATAEVRMITAGVSHQGGTVVEQGLQAGEQVVIDGQMRVVPGGKVEIKPADKPALAANGAPMNGVKGAPAAR